MSKLSYYMSYLEYIIRGKNSQHFYSSGIDGEMILVLISYLGVQRNPSVRLYSKGNKTGHAQYETCTHLATHNLIQISLFMLFHYLILISVPQMLSYSTMHESFFFQSTFHITLWVFVCVLCVSPFSQWSKGSLISLWQNYRSLKLLPTEYISLSV